MCGLISGRCVLTLILLRKLWISRKLDLVDATALYFNNAAVVNCESHKHLGPNLDKKLVFGHLIGEKILKANKGIGSINRLRKFLPRDSLLTIYKAFVIPHLDYGDSIYDNPGNASFIERLEFIQYNASLVITGCFRGTSKEKLYSELGLECLADRCFCRRLCAFFKIVNGFAHMYLSNYLPAHNVASVSLRSRPQIYPLRARTEYYRNSFFPFCILQWNNLDPRIRNLPSIDCFKRVILKFTRPSPASTFRVSKHQGIILLTRLRVGFSHLREHKFRHGFLDTIRPYLFLPYQCYRNYETLPIAML